ITQPIDTGIQGWIWNWNLGRICQAQAPISPINPPESGVTISPPSLPAPDPPTPPSVEPPQVLVLPPVPQPVIAAPPAVAAVLPVPGALELPTPPTPVDLPAPTARPQALGLLFQPRHARRHTHAATTTTAPRAGVLGVAATLQAPPPPLTTVAQAARDR